jgi:hypothetical protein
MTVPTVDAHARVRATLSARAVFGCVRRVTGGSGGRLPDSLRVASSNRVPGSPVSTPRFVLVGSTCRRRSLTA